MFIYFVFNGCAFDLSVTWVGLREKRARAGGGGGEKR